MSEKGTRKLNHYLKAGWALSIQEKSREALAATVTTVSPRRLALELSGPRSEPPFQSGERVWIKYWDEGSVVYRWEAKVVRTHGPGNRIVDLTITSKKVATQRRKSYRVRVKILLSGTVIDAGDTELIGARILDCKTKNISVAGLAFDTKLPLQVGDKLELNLELPSSEKLNAVGWVVRADAVKRKEYKGTIIVSDINSIAVEFLQPEAKEQTQLLNFLRSQMSP